MSTETVSQALQRGKTYLERRGVESGLRNARFLLAHALGGDVARLVARMDDALAPSEARRYGGLLCARGARQPLQYLLGQWEFWGIELEVGPGALIPRPDTETLVETVLRELTPGPLRLADVGTGSGAIAIALAHERPRWRLFASDRSAEALAIARRNVDRHRLAERVELAEGDLLAALAGRVEPGSLDAVVSNPPYVSEREYGTLAPELGFEPRAALVAGERGVEIYERLVPEAARWLAPGGLLALELGHGQAAEVSDRVRDSGSFTDPTRVADLGGIERVLTARRR